MSIPDKPTNPATLATPPGTYLWRHYRFEFPLSGSAEARRLAPVLHLLANLAHRRWDAVGRIKGALERTQLVCIELIDQLQSEDSLSRGSRFTGCNPSDLIVELTALDNQISQLVMAVKDALSIEEAK